MKRDPRRRRRTAGQWSELIEAHARSDLSQRAFCEAQGVSLSAFVRALSKQRAAEGNGEEPHAPAQFVPVTLDAPPGGHWELELQLGSSVVVRVRGS